MTDKEWLEIIKFLRKSEKTVAPGMQPSELISRKDVDWLINRVGELEKEKDEWKDTAQSYYMTNQELREQNKRYKQALEEIIRQHELEDEIDDYDFMWNVKQIARQALEGEK